MGMTTLRPEAPERPDASTYWRRRFVALVVGLSALAIVAWALSGAVRGSAAPHHAGGATHSHGVTTLAPPSPSPASTGPAASRPAVSPSVHSSVAAKKVAAPACPAGDIVLSLFSSQANYSARQMPEFQVDVVSTDAQTCTLDIGAKHLWLRIFAGSVKVWTSAQCAEGEASLVTELHRGVPTVVPIGWNGQTSGTSCPGPATTVTRGNYTATASDGTQVSNTLTFRIN